MSGLPFRAFLLVLFCAGSLGAAGVGVGTVTADERDGEPFEWEEQVAADARGDVLLHWAGTIDLYYMTVGELYSITLGEPFLLLRVGYNITQPGEEDVQLPAPDTPPGTPQPSIPELQPPQVLSTINVTFNVSGERSVRIGLFSVDHGGNWVSDQGQLVSAAEDVRGHRELLFIAPFRRFALQDGDILSDYNITALRGTRVTDDMQGFQPIHDYAPDYFRVHPLIDRVRNGDLLPLPVPVPPPPQPPVPVPEPPVPLPDPKEVLPDDPWPYPPDTGPQGVPYGIPTKRQLDDWDPQDQDDRDGDPPPLQPERLTEDPGDLRTSRATNVSHRLQDGTGRLVARADQEIYTASFNHVAWANVTVESHFETLDQRVLMLVAGISNSRWAWRYGLDMPLGVKDLPAGGSVRMSMIGVPASLFAAARVPATAVFISDWGGIDLVPITFVNTNAPADPQLIPPDETLPRQLVVDILNADDPFRVNEVRKVMVRVRTPEGIYVSGLEAVRAYIYPAGTTVPPRPYQLREKAWMDGVYEIDFVFNRPGAWKIDVFFFDYPANRNGQYPDIDFRVRVDHEGDAQPIIPVPAALGSVGLFMLAVAARERLAKTR